MAGATPMAVDQHLGREQPFWEGAIVLYVEAVCQHGCDAESPACPTVCRTSRHNVSDVSREAAQLEPALRRRSGSYAAAWSRIVLAQRNGEN